MIEDIGPALADRLKEAMQAVYSAPRADVIVCRPDFYEAFRRALTPDVVQQQGAVTVRYWLPEFTR